MNNRDDRWVERDEIWGSDEFIEERGVSAWLRGLIVLIPLVVFLGLAILFAFSLGSGDPSRVPSPKSSSITLR